jgi:isoaspartyl peptidase/L-asparaginase-like protein (Ntn-hydrolase superfamily)
MVTSNTDEVFVIVHLGVGLVGKRDSLEARKNLLHQVLRGCKVSHKHAMAPDAILLQAITALETSDLVNAGVGSNLTEHMTVECEASFASRDCFASVACLSYNKGEGPRPLPAVLAYQ